jgi:4'-phosphopantetheinyl transferase
MIAGCSFELRKSDVHIWTLPTGALDSVAAKLESVLVADERDRAARFRFDHLRQSFVIAHGALRCLLARYLKLDPASIRFNYGSKGKPALASATLIQFNMTHSGSLAAVALTLGCQIGVDIERIRPLSEIKQIAGRFFCPEEASEIMSVPPSERERAFFCCWTRKEAYVKAIGDGLSAPLDQFRVTLLPGQPARFVHLGNNNDDAEDWTLHDLTLAPNYAAALAYHDQPRSLSLFPILDPEELLNTE